MGREAAGVSPLPHPRREDRADGSPTRLSGDTYPDAAELTSQVQGRLPRVVHHARIGLVL